MRRFLVFGVLVGAAASVAMFAGACSGGGSSASPRPDAGTSGGDAGPLEEAAVSQQCGDAPWANIGLEVVGLSAFADAAPLPGVAFTSPLCPALVRYSDDAGMITGQVSQNVPFYASLKKIGYMPELTPEETFDADLSGVSFDMLPLLFEAILKPPFSASSTAVLVSASALVADAGPCSQLEGVAFTVVGHPEAQVTYYTTDSLPSAIDGGTATSSRGLATIAGLAPSQFVTVTATKPGCHVALAHGSLTGRVRVEAGFLSLMPAYVSP